MFAILFSFFLLLTAKTTWYSAYDLPKSEIDTLIKTNCYRGLYGGADQRTLSLFTCPLKSARQFSVLPSDTFLCVVEFNQVRHVQTALHLMNFNNATHELLFVGNQEIIISSRTNSHEKPSMCSEIHFEGADNVLYVPRVPVLPQRPEPVDNPAYIKSILKKNMIPDPYIERILTSYQKQRVTDETMILATGRDGTNTKVTRNSYSIALGRGGCADASWKCANHATQYVVDSITQMFRNYIGEWSVITNGFRSDMCHNVILDIAGEAEPEKFVLTGAHLDSRNTGSGPTATDIAPGADDNGSGSAVHLELARVIAENNVRFAYSVRLMWFCGEEQGLIGSAALARAYASEGLDVQAMFNMDMIGYTNPPNGVTLSFMTGAATPWLSTSCKEISRTYLPTLAVADTQACCSDQQSFYNAGFPAAGIFETPTRSVVYPQYHRIGDQWNNGLINYDQIWQFGRAISACILEYAVPLPPGKTA